jgi:hypothetical protein
MNFKKRATAALLAAGAMAAAGYAYAAVFYTQTAYYSDASYTTQVGTRTATCNRQVYLTGSMTPYSKVVDRYNCDL